VLPLSARPAAAAAAAPPARRYCMQSQGNTSRCAACNSQTNLWICLICGHVGCGRCGHAQPPGRPQPPQPSASLLPLQNPSCSHTSTHLPASPPPPASFTPPHPPHPTQPQPPLQVQGRPRARALGGLGALLRAGAGDAARVGLRGWALLVLGAAGAGGW
jgi:hypothetical protein